MTPTGPRGSIIGSGAKRVVVIVTTDGEFTMTDPDHDHGAFGDESDASTRLLWEADFEDAEDYRVERQESGSVAFENGQLHVDCTDEGGVTVWTPREFPSDVLVEYTATVHEPDEAVTSRNLNCFLAATDPDEPLADQPRSGSYDDYHDFPNYIFTLTRTHSRLRRDPGFEEVSGLMLGAQPDTEYAVRVRKQAGRIVATVNGRVLHDWTDDDPHGAGWVGLRTYNTDVTYDRWAVHGIE